MTIIIQSFIHTGLKNGGYLFTIYRKKDATLLQVERWRNFMTKKELSHLYYLKKEIRLVTVGTF